MTDCYILILFFVGILTCEIVRSKKAKMVLDHFVKNRNIDRFHYIRASCIEGHRHGEGFVI